MISTSDREAPRPRRLTLAMLSARVAAWPALYQLLRSPITPWLVLRLLKKSTAWGEPCSLSLIRLVVFTA